MTAEQSGHMLDNPTWHSLNSHQAHLSLGTALAKRYMPEIGPYAGLADHSDDSYQDLKLITKAGEVIALFETYPPQAIPGWETLNSLSVEQMVSQQPVPTPELTVEVLELTTADAEEMVQLSEQLDMGPFYTRSIELGRFIGIRQQGQLVAMVGQRAQLPGYIEISEVCTHPEWRGRGYARMLCSVMINDIWASGDIPFLHVFATNTVARHLYETLHFSKRCDLNGIIIRYP